MRNLLSLQSSAPSPVRHDRAPGHRLGSDRILAASLAFLGLCFFVLNQSESVTDALRLALPDSDDTMRLVGIRDLLAGQSWLDYTQYRYLPPGGVPMHWSRLVDLPLAAGTSGLTPFLGAASAEKVVVAFWPPLLFLAYAGLIGWGAWRLFGPLAAGLAVLVAGQMLLVNNLFGAGRIDHHNLQAVLMAGAVIAFGLSRAGRTVAAAGGALCGVSLAIGLETLPFVALIGCAYAISWIFGGKPKASAFAWIAASLAATALAAFFVQ